METASIAKRVAIAITLLGTVALAAAPTAIGAPKQDGSGPVDAGVATRLAAEIHDLTTAAEASPARYGGVWSHGPTAVYMCDLGTGPDGAVDGAIAKLRADGATVTVASCRFPILKLNAVLGAVSTSSLFDDNRIILERWGVDYEKDVVDVGVSSIPSGFVDKVTAAFGPAVYLHTQPEAVAAGRLDDGVPYKGGDRLTGSGSGCTSGFEAETSSGSRYMISAGHCFPLSTWAYVNGNANKPFGAISHRNVGGNSVDAELLNGKTYASTIWNGSVNTGSVLAVTGSGYSCQGCQINFDGSYAGQTLGTVQDSVAFSGTIKEADGTLYKSCCLRDVKATGTLCVGGDSGGPVFAYNGAGGAIAVGIVTAGSSDSDCWYTQVPDILSRWALSIP